MEFYDSTNIHQVSHKIDIDFNIDIHNLVGGLEPWNFMTFHQHPPSIT